MLRLRSRSETCPRRKSSSATPARTGSGSRRSRSSRAFKSIGAVQVLDYAAEEVGYGPLGEALDEQIDRSAVVIAFVSRDYCKKQWTVAEWEHSLTEAHRRRLLFVPLMLDADATVWWESLRKRAKLTALSRDYAYVSFTDAGGGRLDVRPEDTRVNGKIARLVRQIRDDLESGAPTDADPPGGRVAALEAADIVVLAHPKAALPQEMAAQIGRLSETLKGRGCPPRSVERRLAPEAGSPRQGQRQRRHGVRATLGGKRGRRHGVRSRGYRRPSRGGGVPEL